MKLRVIETAYNRYRFRSRLEARWAVFFDALGVEWDYERQGYVLDGAPYLPDFVLPGLRLFVEVKPAGFLAAGGARTARDKLAALAAAIHPAMLVCGDPCDYRSHWFGLDSCDAGGGLNEEEGGWPVAPPEQHENGLLGIVVHFAYAHFNVDHSGRTNVVLSLMRNKSRTILDADYEPIPHYEHLGSDPAAVWKCARAARSARFEFNGDWRQAKIAGISAVPAAGTTKRGGQ